MASLIPSNILSSPSFPPSSTFRRSSIRTSALPTDLPTSAIAVTSFAAIAAAISFTDPERRRQQQSQDLGGLDDKEVVRNYFNNTGYQRWRKIYGDSTEDVNTVQLDIRLGHSKTVENAIQMLKDDRPLSGVTICDAGCGTGSLAIPLAQEGAIVTASDISEAMVSEARSKAENVLKPDSVFPTFEVKDLESLEGKYDTVVCLDVLIHYPQEKAEGMIGHLASLAEKRLILSYAPKTVYFNVLKRIGELFPGPSKATRAYLHAERDVETALRKVGWRVRNKGFISTQFYFANLIEAVPIEN